METLLNERSFCYSIHLFNNINYALQLIGSHLLGQKSLFSSNLDRVCFITLSRRDRAKLTQNIFRTILSQCTLYDMVDMAGDGE